MSQTVLTSGAGARHLRVRVPHRSGARRVQHHLRTWPRCVTHKLLHPCPQPSNMKIKRAPTSASQALHNDADPCAPSFCDPCHNVIAARPLCDACIAAAAQVTPVVGLLQYSRVDPVHAALSTRHSESAAAAASISTAGLDSTHRVRCPDLTNAAPQMLVASPIALLVALWGMSGVRALEQMTAAQVARKCAAHRFNPPLTHSAGTLDDVEQGQICFKQRGHA